MFALFHPIRAIRALSQELKIMAAETDRLTASIKSLTDATDAVVTSYSTLADRLRAAANDPAGISALADEVDSNVARLNSVAATVID